jgi:DNA-binding MarR family transcriptional regulator
VTPPKGKAGIRVSEAYVAEHPDADPTSTELVLNLLSSATIVFNRLEKLLRPHGLSTGSFNVLNIVAGAGEAISPSTIAERLSVPIALPTVTGVLDTLERRGYVVRRAHPADRRKVLVEATSAGIDALGAVLPELVVEEQRWTGGLGPSARSTTVDRLGELYDHLAALEP